jgi:hypothetical protein
MTWSAGRPRPEKSNGTTRTRKRHLLGRWPLNERVVDHAIQGVLIFASVFLAFWLNDYRIQVGERRATQAALEAVVNEVETNRGILERWSPYHREISEKLEAQQLAGGTASGPFNPYAFMDDRGIFREILTYDSWEYLRQSDVRLDLETRLAVNRVFRQQEYVDNAGQAAVSFLSERELFDPARSDENQEEVVECSFAHRKDDRRDHEDSPWSSTAPQ